MIKNIIKLFVILLIGAFIGNVAYGIYREAMLESRPNSDTQNIVIAESENQIQTKQNTKDEELPDKYKGYKVSAKLEIEKIKLKTYIFQEYDEEAMWICPTKYFGPNPNEIGNYCIAAHNYNKKNMFNNIIKLEKGDIIKLSDNINGKVNYIVYDVYKVDPTDTEALSQKTMRKSRTYINYMQ